MTGLLLKKQLREIFRSWFYDAKKNKARSRLGTVLFFLLFVLLMVGVLGGTFTYLALNICAPLAALKLGWLYYVLLGLLALLLGAFGSVFNTYSSLYLAKDNDLLLSLPIPVRAILTSRLLSVYLLGLMYSAVVSVPAVIVYWIRAEVSAASVLGGAAFVLLLSLLVLVLSCLLGWAVAKISLRLKNKSFVTVLASLLFLSLYYFFYFKASAALQELLANAVLYGQRIRGAAYGLYLFGRAAEGEWKALLWVSLAVLALFGLTCWVLSRSFLGIVTSTGAVSRVRYREKAVRQRSADSAFFHKELARFTSSPNYMLNCGLSTVLLPVAGVLLIWKGGEILPTLRSALAARPGSAEALLCAAVCGVCMMNDMATPSVSLEGKNLWLAQSLPVSPWLPLQAKLRLQLVLTMPGVLLCTLCALPGLKPGVLDGLLLVLVTLLYALAYACWCLTLGVLRPDLHWTNEIAPIKQSINVLFAMLLGMLVPLALGGLYLLLGWKLGLTAYLALAGLAFALIALALYRWLKTRGAARFAALS